MRAVTKRMVIAACLVMAVTIASPVLAGRSSVTIEAPETAGKGSVISIRIHVSHEGNSFVHYTDWVYVKVNGKEAMRLEYSPLKRPENENFTREIKYPVNGPSEITAEAHCSLHGSAGIAKKTVRVK